jgi:hypothetical protein
MKILELFSGTKSFSKVAEERGHEVFTVELESKFNPSLAIDILNLTAEIILEKFGRPDVIWASPPCTTFSVASICHYWKDGKPKNEKTLHGIAMVKKTIEIIEALKPKFWIIENPRGMLRKQDFMQNLHRDTVSYCQYGHKIMKPTDLWNNLGFVFKPICKPGASCHIRAGRGSKAGVQGIYNLEWEQARGNAATARGVVPKELCEDIIKHCEEMFK